MPWNIILFGEVGTGFLTEMGETGRGRKGQASVPQGLPYRGGGTARGRTGRGLFTATLSRGLPYHGGGAAYREGGIEEGQEGQQLHLQGGPGVGQGQPAQ